nr:MAG TPA: hypothetical protein [Caudoviricetes sp.]
MFGHVRLNHAKMLSCGSQRAEASSPPPLYNGRQVSQPGG